jgi:uncharacterized protein with PhoU and TrkA domain
MADEEPRNVKELLIEAKDASELIVDLAYAAVFFGDEALANEVHELEQRMSGNLRRLRTIAMLAARSPEDAEAMEAVLWIASAIETIGDAASDIARVVSAHLGLPDALRLDLRHADEIAGRVRVRPEAHIIGQSLREVALPVETGMWLLAIRRGDDWEFDPGPDSVVSEGDVLLFKGPEDGVNLVRELAGAAPLPETPDDNLPPLNELDRAVDIIIEMKNAAEAAVGLAYAALLFNDRALAAEVSAIEARTDVLDDRLESWVLRAAPEARDPDELRGLLRLGAASEWTCDAARNMVWYVEKGEELHPVIAMALSETEEISAETTVTAGSAAEGRTIKELQVETETGMFILAIQRGRRWLHRPRAATRLLTDDRLVSIGPEDGALALAELCGDTSEEED